MTNVLITGGAGFIGSNAAARYAGRDQSVFALDSFARDGTRRNSRWLEREHGVQVREIDVRDSEGLQRAVRRSQPDVVLHLAGQVAVTTSVEDPRTDCMVNVEGTLNLLEAVRNEAPDAHVLYASTNKVYGGLSDVKVTEGGSRYRYRNLPEGVSEQHPLEFRTPYGCSKGAADQYVLDWAHTFDLKTTSLRQSCIYGPRQIGVEAQGWVAWFVRAALSGQELTIYGDGKQVRDLLYVDDLLDLFDAVVDRPERSVGEAFNAGGGREYTLSLLEFLQLLEEQLDRDVPRSFDDWRPGDQRVFYCDTSKARNELGWQPRWSPSEGIARLIDFVEDESWLHEE